MQYDAVKATVEVSHNTQTNLCNKWLEKGVYVVNAAVRTTLPNQSALEEYILIDGAADGRGSHSLTLPAGFQALTHTSVISITNESANLVLQTRHYAGATLSVTGWLHITRLK